MNRLSYITPSDFGGKAGKVQDVDSKLDQWHLYSMFACSCPPENAPDGGAGSVKELLRLVFPFLRAGSENQAVRLYPICCLPIRWFGFHSF